MMVKSSQKTVDRLATKIDQRVIPYKQSPWAYRPFILCRPAHSPGPLFKVIVGSYKMMVKNSQKTVDRLTTKIDQRVIPFKQSPWAYRPFILSRPAHSPGPLFKVVDGSYKMMVKNSQKTVDRLTTKIDQRVIPFKQSPWAYRPFIQSRPAHSPGPLFKVIVGSYKMMVKSSQKTVDRLTTKPNWKMLIFLEMKTMAGFGQVEKGRMNAS